MSGILEFIMGIVGKAKFEKFFNKPIYRSLTAWGVVIFVAGEAGVAQLCGDAVLTYEGKSLFADAWAGSALCNAADKSVAVIGQGLALLGLRRAK